MLLTRHVPAIRMTKLQDDLIAAGIKVATIYAESMNAADITIVVADGTNVAAVDAIVNTYNPNTPNQAELDYDNDKAVLEQLKASYQAFKNSLVSVRNREANIISGPNSPTTAQTGTALKAMANDMVTLTNRLDDLVDALKIYIVRRSI
jgi:hypothetical protein